MGRGDGDQDPSTPHHPTPPPHPAGLILTTTIQALFPPTNYCASYPQPLAAGLLALRPQGHVYTKTEGTRSKRECSCFRICFLAPLTLAKEALREEWVSHM